MVSPITRTSVGDTVPKVNNEVAVGEDVEFQRRWWKFERTVWIVFVVFVLLDIAGVFGRGPAAKAHLSTNDGAIDVTYERIERTGTPSVLTVKFGEAAIRKSEIQLWASEDLVTKLGNKQIAPQPASSTIGNAGLHYTFPATTQPAAAVFSLQPSAPGLYRLTLRTPNSPELNLKIFVMP
jgi:hypothetical protein